MNYRDDIFNCDDLSIDIDKFDNYTGHDEFYAVYTIQLGELIENNIFSWDKPETNWKEAAYNEEQYKRLCSYFIERFYYREIGIEPYLEWARTLKRKLVFELMPKYKPLYERVDEGINPLSDSNEYYKNRTIESSYPETLLSENADYITDGRDEEFQRIKEGNFVDENINYAEKYKNVDEFILDDLECMFISMYTTNINVW